MSERHHPYKPFSSPQIWLRLAALALVSPPTYSQVQSARPNTAAPSFEVVSVKPEGDIHQLPPDAEGRRFFSTKPFRFTPTSVTGIRTLSELVEEAYSVEDWEVVGPAWITISTYAINAKMASPATRSEARLMLQTMLAERFGLVLHHESRTVPVLALVEGKGGVKLKAATEGEKPYSRMFMGANATYSATFNLDGIAANTRSFCESPVVNETGIQGVYHVELAWTREAGGAGRYDPGFWEAPERETGLKAEKRKLPRDVIVIDHAERIPTAN